MRKFHNVNKTLNSKLMKIFPNIDSVHYGTDHKMEGYTYLAVSVFEKWLGKENYHLLENVSIEEDTKRIDILNLFLYLVPERKVYMSYYVWGVAAFKV